MQLTVFAEKSPSQMSESMLNLSLVGIGKSLVMIFLNHSDFLTFGLNILLLPPFFLSYSKLDINFWNKFNFNILSVAFSVFFTKTLTYLVTKIVFSFCFWLLNVHMLFFFRLLIHNPFFTEGSRREHRKCLQLLWQSLAQLQSFLRSNLHLQIFSFHNYNSQANRTSDIPW